MSRPETHIAVVTHSAFLWFTLACYGNEYSKRVRENLQRWWVGCWGDACVRWQVVRAGNRDGNEGREDSTIGVRARPDDDLDGAGRAKPGITHGWQAWESVKVE